MGEFGIIGDDFGVELPELKVDNKELMDEKKAARFSKSAEFKKLKEHLEARIAYYQTFLPSGEPIAKDFSKENWVIANTIIGEFKAIINAYEQAQEIVKNAK